MSPSDPPPPPGGGRRSDQPSSEDLFRDLGRRAPVAGAPAARPHQVRRPPPPSPATRAVLRSFLRWILTIMRYLLSVAWDSLRGRSTLEGKALRMRAALEGMGSTGTKVGRQLSMRIDLMPLEFSLQLAAMRDQRTPMPFETAMKRLTAAVGRPLEQVFEVIDPTPIASSTVDCVYQAVLKGGERVAIKVRREGIRSQILADLRALGWITRLLEQLAVVRPDFYDQLRAELLDLATEELDFTLQARSQTIFRRRARRDRIRWLSAPRIYHRLCSHDVMISELVAGVRCSEIIDAMVAQDRTALQRLRQMGIDHRRVARRLLQASWWGLYENIFFIAQPAPENIVVQPGDRLCFLDFADRGTLSSGRRRQHEQVLSRLSNDDVSGAAQSLVGMLSPLPFIDTYDFGKHIESGLWEHLFALRDKDAEWWERTTIGIWTAVISAARANEVKLRLEVLRMMRACISYEALAARLRPRLRLLSEYERYRVGADRRAARRFLRDIGRKDPDELAASAVATVARVSEGLIRVGLFVESTVENLPVTRLALSGKAAYVASQVLRLGVTLAILLVGATVVHVLATLDSPERLRLIQHAALAARHPVTGVLLFGVIAVTLRRILYRLDDKGGDD